jgi:hypothetical protein
MNTPKFRVVQSKDSWNGMPVRQYDFLFTPDAIPSDLGAGNVRVLISARKNCAPYVKWVWSGTKRQGWAESAYRWLVTELGQKLKVTAVGGPDSVAFHTEMKKRGLVSGFTLN